MLIMSEIIANKEDKLLFNATYVSQQTNISIATVTKLLKLLSKKGLLKSFRGSSGGYQLIKKAGEVNILDIMTAIEGEVSLTMCTSKLKCEFDQDCQVKHGWHKLNNLFLKTFQQISLQDLIDDNINFSLLRN